MIFYNAHYKYYDGGWLEHASDGQSTQEVGDIQDGIYVNCNVLELA